MRRVLAVGLTVLLSVLLITTVSAEGTVVASLSTDCVVEQDGACTLTLRMTVNFAPGTEGFAIPIASAARNVTCSLPYSLRAGDGCKLLTFTGVQSGPTDVVLSYRLAETVTDDGSSQLFAVQLLYPAWSCAIEAYEVTVTLPGAFEGLPVFLSGYYGDLIDNYMDITIDEGTIRAVLNPAQSLKDHEAMSLQLTLPRDYFDLRFLAGKTVRVVRLLFLGLLLLTAAYWLVFVRNLPLRPKRQAMPPEGCNPGEIPFLLTSRAPDLALMVAHWASLGYLTLTRTRRGRIRLTRQIEMGTERRRYEEQIFHTLFARGDQCDIRSAEFLKARSLAAEKSRGFWQKRVFDPKAGSPALLRLLALGAGLALCFACFDLWVASKSWRWFLILPLTALGGLACLAVQYLGGCLLRRHTLRALILGGLGAVFLLAAGRGSGLTLYALLNLAFQLGIGLLLRCGGRRTKAGAALAAELLGYRRWLYDASADQLKANLETDPQFFYRILPFADALRVARFVTGSLGSARLEPCDWLIWEGSAPKTAPGFYDRYCRLLAALRGERAAGAKHGGRKAPVSTQVVLPRRRRTNPFAPSGRPTGGDRTGGRR